jgi:NDP-sugar pyrophosphorylase family protein
MQVGAILVLGGCIDDGVSVSSAPIYFPQSMPSFFGAPATMLDLLGEPILYRIIESMRKSGVGPIFLITDDILADHVVIRDISRWRVHVRSAPAEELGTAMHAALINCRENGSRASIVMQASKYVELDVAAMTRFHIASGQSVTFARDRIGPLGIAMVGGESAKVVLPEQQTAQCSSHEYVHGQYVNRLSTSQDLRRLAQDALLQRCSIRPNGSEVRPGVWVSPSARLHPRARVVNPAYIGAHTRLRSGVVITRCTSVEHDCEIDRGSVVENASILPHTYLGPSLDISHSIVNCNSLVDIRRAVEVEIGDRSLIGSTSRRPHCANGRSQVKSVPLIGNAPWQVLSEAIGAFLPVLLPKKARFSYDAAEPWPRLEEAPRPGNSPAVGG